MMVKKHLWEIFPVGAQIACVKADAMMALSKVPKEIYAGNRVPSK
jgi:hypothetical protein